MYVLFSMIVNVFISFFKDNSLLILQQGISHELKPTPAAEVARPVLTRRDVLRQQTQALVGRGYQFRAEIRFIISNIFSIIFILFTENFGRVQPILHPNDCSDKLFKFLHSFKCAVMSQLPKTELGIHLVPVVLHKQVPV